MSELPPPPHSEGFGRWLRLRSTKRKEYMEVCRRDFKPNAEPYTFIWPVDGVNVKVETYVCKACRYDLENNIHFFDFMARSAVKGVRGAQIVASLPLEAAETVRQPTNAADGVGRRATNPGKRAPEAPQTRATG